MGLQNKTAVIDSASRLLICRALLTTAVIYMGIDDATYLHSVLTNNTGFPYTVDGNGNFGVECSLNVTLAVQIGGAIFNISSLDYVGAITASYPKGPSWCESKIVGFPGNLSYWSFGNNFLRNVRSPIGGVKLIPRGLYCVGLCGKSNWLWPTANSHRHRSDAAPKLSPQGDLPVSLHAYAL